jgi:putative membrane protein
MMMYWYGSGMSGWGYGLMTVGLILFWGAVIVALVALVRYLSQTRQQTTALPSQQTPEQMLAERFARGEIGEDEYQQRLTALRTVGQARAPGSGQAQPPVGTNAH